MFIIINRPFRRVDVVIPLSFRTPRFLRVYTFFQLGKFRNFRLTTLINPNSEQLLLRRENYDENLLKISLTSSSVSRETVIIDLSVNAVSVGP